MDIRFPVVFCLFLSYELCSKFSGWAYTQCHPKQNHLSLFSFSPPHPFPLQTAILTILYAKHIFFSFDSFWLCI